MDEPVAQALTASALRDAVAGGTPAVLSVLNEAAPPPEVDCTGDVMVLADVEPTIRFAERDLDGRGGAEIVAEISWVEERAQVESCESHVIVVFDEVGRALDHFTASGNGCGYHAPLMGLELGDSSVVLSELEPEMCGTMISVRMLRHRLSVRDDRVERIPMVVQFDTYQRTGDGSRGAACGPDDAGCRSGLECIDGACTPQPCAQHDQCPFAHACISARCEAGCYDAARAGSSLRCAEGQACEYEDGVMFARGFGQCVAHP
jgi:hypothetical protein